MYWIINKIHETLFSLFLVGPDVISVSNCVVYSQSLVCLKTAAPTALASLQTWKSTLLFQKPTNDEHWGSLNLVFHMFDAAGVRCLHKRVPVPRTAQGVCVRLSLCREEGRRMCSCAGSPGGRLRVLRIRRTVCCCHMASPLFTQGLNELEHIGVVETTWKPTRVSYRLQKVLKSG